LYNKPVPPRPPPIPTSPPSTPSQSSPSLVDTVSPSPRARRPSNTRKAVPSSWDPGSITPQSPRTPVTTPKDAQNSPSGRVAPSSPQPLPANGHAKSSQVKEDKQRSSPARVPKQFQSGINDSGTKASPFPLDHQSSKSKASDSDQSAILAALSQHAHEMRRLLMPATNADECRLIVDMFLAKSGLHMEPVDHSKPFLLSDASQTLPFGVDAELEHSLVELFLGGMTEEESEVAYGDDPIIPPAESTAPKESPVALPMSPPDTPHSSHDNRSETAEPVVINDTHAATPMRAAAT